MRSDVEGAHAGAQPGRRRARASRWIAVLPLLPLVTLQGRAGAEEGAPTHGGAAPSKHWILPAVGAGYGAIVVDDEALRALQTGFAFGWEKRTGGTLHPGWLFRFDAAFADFEAEETLIRFDMAPLFSLAAGFDERARFFRIAVGPLLQRTNRTGYGGGGLVDLSAGFKNLAEVYVAGQLSVDTGSTGYGAFAGLRVNSDWFMERFGYGDAGEEAGGEESAGDGSSAGSSDSGSAESADEADSASCQDLGSIVDSPGQCCSGRAVPRTGQTGLTCCIDKGPQPCRDLQK